MPDILERAKAQRELTLSELAMTSKGYVKRRYSKAIDDFAAALYYLQECKRALASYELDGGVTLADRDWLLRCKREYVRTGQRRRYWSRQYVKVLLAERA